MSLSCDSVNPRVFEMIVLYVGHFMQKVLCTGRMGVGGGGKGRDIWRSPPNGDNNSPMQLSQILLKDPCGLHMPSGEALSPTCSSGFGPSIFNPLLRLLIV